MDRRSSTHGGSSCARFERKDGSKALARSAPVVSMVSTTKCWDELIDHRSTKTVFSIEEVSFSNRPLSAVIGTDPEKPKRYRAIWWQREESRSPRQRTYRHASSSSKRLPHLSQSTRATLETAQRFSQQKTAQTHVNGRASRRAPHRYSLILIAVHYSSSSDASSPPVML